MTNLDLALIYWNEGNVLPLDLAAKLMAEGLDVEALEAKHMQ